MSGFKNGFAVLPLVVAAAVAVPGSASAQTSADICHAQLGDLDEAQTTLDELLDTVAKAEADRDRLQTRDAELAISISTASGSERDELKAERAQVRSELATIAKLLPPIKAQADALAVELDAAQRAYIACIERTL